MFKNERKKFVYMAINLRERGFTLLSTLLIILIISITMPLLTSLLSSISYSTNDDTFSIQHFFYFLRNDLLAAVDYKVEHNKLFLDLPSKKTAMIEKYGSVIRRQIDGKGHEIYLRDVKELTFKPKSYGVYTKVTSIQGEIYEKTIIFYE